MPSGTVTPAGGGGGFTPVSLGLQVATLAIGTVASHALKWSGAFDNLWDANVLAVLPAGIGLTVAFDGSNGTITTTTAGVWALAYRLETPAGNAGYVGSFHDDLGLAIAVSLPVRAALATDTVIAGTAYLPTATVFAPRIDTTTAPAAQDLSAQLLITRLA